MAYWLAQVKLEDVFKSTQDNMAQGPGEERLIALGVGAVAMLVLLLVLHYRRRSQAGSRPLNHPNRLLKEATKALALRSAEVRCIRELAREQSCRSPLVLLLCPSVLAKAAAKKSPEQKKIVRGLIERMGQGS